MVEGYVTIISRDRWRVLGHSLVYHLTIILWLKGVTISIPMLGTLQYWQNCCIPVPNSVNISCFDSTDLQMLLMTSCFTTMITRKLNEQCLTRMWPDFHDADRWGHWNASQSIKYLMLQWIAVYIWILDAKSETTRIRNPPCQKGRNTSLLYKLCFAASLSCCIYIYIYKYIHKAVVEKPWGIQSQPGDKTTRELLPSILAWEICRVSTDP